MPVFSINADEEDMKGDKERLIRHEVSGSRRSYRCVCMCEEFPEHKMEI